MYPKMMTKSILSKYRPSILKNTLDDTAPCVFSAKLIGRFSYKVTLANLLKRNGIKSYHFHSYLSSMFKISFILSSCYLYLKLLLILIIITDWVNISCSKFLHWPGRKSRMFLCVAKKLTFFIITDFSHILVTLKLYMI